MQALDDQDKPKTKKTTVSNETKQGSEEIKSTDEPSTLLFLTGHETQHHEMSVALACSADRTLTCAQMHAYVEAAKEQFNTQRCVLKCMLASVHQCYCMIRIVCAYIFKVLPKCIINILQALKVRLRF